MSKSDKTTQPAPEPQTEPAKPQAAPEGNPHTPFFSKRPRDTRRMKVISVRRKGEPPSSWLAPVTEVPSGQLMQGVPYEVSEEYGAYLIERKGFQKHEEPKTK